MLQLFICLLRFFFFVFFGGEKSARNIATAFGIFLSSTQIFQHDGTNINRCNLQKAALKQNDACTNKQLPDRSLACVHGCRVMSAQRLWTQINRHIFTPAAQYNSPCPPPTHTFPTPHPICIGDSTASFHFPAQISRTCGAIES